jgi:hypothetical protein
MVLQFDLKVQMMVKFFDIKNEPCFIFFSYFKTYVENSKLSVYFKNKP